LNLKLSVWQSWVKRSFQKQVTLQPKGQANNNFVPDRQPWFFAKECLIEVDWACEVVGNSGCIRW
jgi:hypothetical protein